MYYIDTIKISYKYIFRNPTVSPVINKIIVQKYMIQIFINILQKTMTFHLVEEKLTKWFK